MQRTFWIQTACLWIQISIWRKWDRIWGDVEAVEEKQWRAERGGKETRRGENQIKMFDKMFDMMFDKTFDMMFNMMFDKMFDMSHKKA